MKNVGSGICVKNISDLVLKKINGIYETKNPSKEQVHEHKMTKKQIYKNFTNLSQEQLNAINNKETYVKNDVMTTIIKRCRGEKKRGIRIIDGIRNKLIFTDFEIPKCPEFGVKSKITKTFKNHNFLEKNSVKIYEVDSYFYKHYEKKYKLIKMGVNIYYLELIFTSVNIL